MMFQTRALCAEQAAAALDPIRFNPYRAQKEWPPDFTKMPPKQQFRLERKYRRRAKLRYSRPGWIKGVKLATWGSCSGVAVYSIFFMDWGTSAEHPPFAGVRGWMSKKIDSIWTVNAPSKELRLPESRTPD